MSSKPQINGNKQTSSELERQLERSGFFTHSALSNQAERINEIESFLYGLIDTLIAEGVIDKNAFEKTVKNVRDETLQKQEHFHAGIAISIDNDEHQENFVPVNCEERLPVCNAVCCKLNFALSVAEIESGHVKWDLGQPYFIRQIKNGYCTHLKSRKACVDGCSIYDERPGVCRKYSCAEDKRIWMDFDKMLLNHKWIDENLVEQKIQLREVYMIPENKIEYKSNIE